MGIGYAIGSVTFNYLSSPVTVDLLCFSLVTLLSVSRENTNRDIRLGNLIGGRSEDVLDPTTPPTLSQFLLIDMCD